MSDTAQRTRPLVYIVDDDDIILSSLSVVLRRAFEVKTCNSPSRALEEIRTARPDIIVLDIRMPEHDGFWLFAEIRKFDAQASIIFNSAYQDALSSREVVGAFIPFSYLPKSGNFSDFQEVMYRAAQHAGYKNYVLK